jgi:Peptidase M50B-like
VPVLAAVASDVDKVTWTAALIAWVLAVPMFFAGRFLTVLAHEGGHAFMAVAVFRLVKGITIKTSAEGETEPDKNVWPFYLLVAAFGYLGPSLFGLFAAWLLLHDPAETVLWGSIAFLAVMLLATRGFFGPLLIICLMVALYQIVTKAEPSLVTLAAHVWTWFLLISGVQRMLMFMRTRNYNAKGNDTDWLRKGTLLPQYLWAVILLVGTIAALVYGGGMLLRLTT